jgi:hypothetical protein
MQRRHQGGYLDFYEWIIWVFWPIRVLLDRINQIRSYKNGVFFIAELFAEPHHMLHRWRQKRT